MTNQKTKEPVFNVDAYRLWLEDRAKVASTLKTSHFITISREYGCDAYPLAGKLQELINSKHPTNKWLVFTSQIIEKLAQDEKLGADLISSVSEKRYSFMNWFIDGLVPDYLQSVQSQVFERMRTLILNLSEKGNVIIIGAGSQIVTNELDPSKFAGTHVRLYASYPWRLKSIMEKFHKEREAAEEQLKTKQNARNKFVEDFTGKSSADPLLYHMMINNDKNTPDMMAAAVFHYCESRGFFK